MQAIAVGKFLLKKRLERQYKMLLHHRALSAMSFSKSDEGAKSQKVKQFALCPFPSLPSRWEKSPEKVLSLCLHSVQPIGKKFLKKSMRFADSEYKTLTFLFQKLLEVMSRIKTSIIL